MGLGKVEEYAKNFVKLFNSFTCKHIDKKKKKEFGIVTSHK